MADMNLALRIRVNADGSVQVLNQVGQSIHGVGNAATAASGNINHLSGSVRSLTSSIAPFLTVAALFTLGHRIVEDTAAVQDLNTRLHTLTATAGDYSQTVAYVNQVADDQHKSINDLSGSYAKLRNLQNSGIITATQTQGLFEGLNNAASALGASNEQLSGTFYGLAQGLSSGIVRAEEFNQVTEPLPGLLQSLDKAAGLSAGGFRKLVNDGKVTSDMFANVLVKALHDYDGAAAATANNINAKSTDIGNSWTRLITSIEQPVTFVVAPFLDGAKTALDALRELNESAITVGDTNVSASSLVQGAWFVASNSIMSAWVILKEAGLGAVADIVTGWVGSGDEILASVKGLANGVIALFVGVGRSVGVIFATIVSNIQNSIANVSAYASATAGDVARLALGDFSFSSTKSVVFKPVVSGSVDLKNELKGAFATDYIGNLSAAVQGAAVGYQKLANEQKQANEVAEQTKAKALQAAQSHQVAAKAVDGQATSHKKAASSAKSHADSVQKGVASEIQALNDQHAKLTLSERGYYASTLAAKGFGAAQQAMALAIWDSNLALDAQKKADDKAKSAMDSLIDQYQRLTLSARDYYAETLKKDGIKPDRTPALLAQFDQNTALETQKNQIDATRQSVDSYVNSLDSAKTSMMQLGDVSSTVLDGALGGINTLVGAFAKYSDSVNENTKALAELNKKQIENSLLASRDTKNAAIYAANAIKFSKEEQRLTVEKTSLEIDGARQIAGASAQMFGEKTAAAKAFHAVEMGLAVVSIAMKAQEMAASVAATGVKLAEGAASMFAQSGWGGFAGVAAMIAVMAALGYAAASSGSTIAAPPESSPDTGTVLGDATSQSNSTDNIVELLKDIHAAEYPELRGINAGVNNLQAALSATITTLFQAGGLDLSNEGIDLSYTLEDSLSRSFTTGAGIASTILSSGISTAISVGTTAAIAGLSGAAVTGATTASAGILSGLGLGSIAGPIGMLAGLLFSGISALFTGGYRKVVERGIQTPAQSVADIQMGGFTASQYNVVKTRQWDMFSDSTRYDTIQTKLSTEVETAISDVFVSAGDVSLQLAQALGNDLDQKVKSYVIPALKIDLTGLNAEDASKKLNAVISTALDKMAVDVFGDTVGKYQQIGEGMLETTVRIVTEIALVRDALNQSGISMGADAIAISDALVTAAGGLKEFQQQFSDYYDKFYSDTEKQTRLQGVLSSQLGSVYLALPDTRAGYRDLLEALDLNNAKDRERYSILLQLASAADTYYQSLESGLKSYQDNIVSAYDTAAGLLQRQIDTYRGFVDQLTAYKDSLLTGNQSTATPEQKYAASKNAFLEIKQTLATGTVAEKETALGNLQSVIAKYLEASRGYNASGVAYIKDFTDAQALLASAIGSSKTKADTAQLQLDTLTKQVTELGLIKTAVMDVETAVNAVGIAISTLKEFQQAQQNAAKEAANKAAFSNIEAGRKTNYEKPISAAAQARGETAQKIESKLGWSNKTSKNAFSAEAMINAQTGAITSGEVYQGSSQGVKDSLRDGNFYQVRGQFGAIGNLIQSIVGGALPEVFVKISAGAGDDPGQAMYRFADKSQTVKGDNIDPLVRLYANDAADYLADQLSNKDWASQIKAINFSSIGAGVSELSSLMAHLKNPFKNGVYDPKKDYTKIDGSHRAGLDRVPFDGYVAELHQGERVLTAPESAAYNQQTINNQTVANVGGAAAHNQQTTNTDPQVAHLINKVSKSVNNQQASTLQMAGDTSSQTTSNLALTNWHQSVVDGSHRAGLDRVPFDGYVAELHQGERVLTAEQSTAYNEQAASVFANWYQSVMASGSQFATQVEAAEQDKSPTVLPTQPQRIEVAIARPSWLDEPQAKANPNTGSGNDKEVIKQLEKQNAELVKQTKAMEKTIQVLQAGFNKLIEQGADQVESLDGIETRMRVRELS